MREVRKEGRHGEREGENVREGEEGRKRWREGRRK